MVGGACRVFLEARLDLIIDDLVELLLLGRIRLLHTHPQPQQQQSRSSQPFGGHDENQQSLKVIFWIRTVRPKTALAVGQKCGTLIGHLLLGWGVCRTCFVARR